MHDRLKVRGSRSAAFCIAWRRGVQLIAVLGLSFVGACTGSYRQPRRPAVTATKAFNTGPIAKALNQHLAKTPVVMYFGSPELFQSSLGPLRSFLDAGVLRTEPIPGLSTDNVTVRLGPLGRTLARKDHWTRRTAANRAPWYATVGWLRQPKLLAVRVPKWPGRLRGCVHAQFVATFVLTKAGIDLRPYAGNYSPMGFGFWPSSAFLSRPHYDFTLDFGDAGKNVTGHILFCKALGTWVALPES